MTREQHDLLWMLAKGEKLPDDAGALYLAIEARINTPAPLRPMSEAPVNTQLLEALKAMDQHIMELAMYIDLKAPASAHGELDSIRELQQAAIQVAEVQG